MPHFEKATDEEIRAKEKQIMSQFEILFKDYTQGNVKGMPKKGKKKGKPKTSTATPLDQSHVSSGLDEEFEQTSTKPATDNPDTDTAQGEVSLVTNPAPASKKASEANNVEMSVGNFNLLKIQPLRPNTSTESEEEEPKSKRMNPMEVTKDRYKYFMCLLDKCIDTAKSVEMKTVMAFFEMAEMATPFSEAEMSACIKKMEDDNKVMLADTTLYRIS